MNIYDCLKTIKHDIEECIITGKNGNKQFENGLIAKESFIRSSKLIGLLHETVKHNLIEHGVYPRNIFPPFGFSNPEIKLAGFLKQKDQDITVVPRNIEPKKTEITWGPLSYEGIFDNYGLEYTRRSLVINVRSQLSSLAKNADTLFERTFAEAMNLHLIYNDIVLGDVYLIPVYEYEQSAAKNNKIKFSNHRTSLEKYISFFSSISGRKDATKDEYKYERCALIIADFSQEDPVLYSTTKQLKDANLISQDFDLELADISYPNMIDDLLDIYSKRFDINDIVFDDNVDLDKIDDYNE